MPGRFRRKNSVSISALIHASTDDLELRISQARLLLVNDLPALLYIVESPYVVIPMSFGLTCNDILYREDRIAAPTCTTCGKISEIVWLCALGQLCQPSTN